MRAESLSYIQKELKRQSPGRIVELCIRMAKYKKENKELLTYLLFESGDEEGYIEMVKKEIDAAFEGINMLSFYFIKKTLRKILRIANKHIKYSGVKTTEVELRLYFCQKINSGKIAVNRNKVLQNLYNGQVEKITTAVSRLHEDLQFDYLQEIEKL